jgi:hypothetical protein
MKNKITKGQTDVKVPEGWFNQIPSSDEFVMQNLEIALGKDGARKIKNIDRFKNYTLVVSANKYDPESHSGINPTVNFVLAKNKLNYVIEDFQKTKYLLLSQLESAGVSDINLKESKFIYFENGKKAYKMKVEYKLPNFFTKIITTNIHYLINSEFYAQLTLIGTEKDMCTSTFSRIKKQLNLLDK